MFGHSKIVGFTALFALLSPTLATRYRLDDRDPATIKAAGGFVAWNPQGTGTVIDHALKKLGDQDPWISTTDSNSWAKDSTKGTLDIWLYHIDESGIDFVDVEKAFKEAGEDQSDHPAEEEFAVKGYIAWESIKGWQHYKRGKEVKEDKQSRKDFDKNNKRDVNDEFDDGNSINKRDEDDEFDDDGNLINSAKFRAAM